MPEKVMVHASAIWLRRIGDQAQVLLEIDGRWRLVITDFADSSYSHIAEGRGFANWPLDAVTEES